MTEERCGLTGLLVNACGCAKHRGGEVAQDLPGAWFRAAYFGTCTRCDSRFGPGEFIRADGQEGYECCDD